MNLKTLRAALAAMALLCGAHVSAQTTSEPKNYDAMFCVNGVRADSHCFGTLARAVQEVTIGPLATHEAHALRVEVPTPPGQSNFDGRSFIYHYANPDLPASKVIPYFVNSDAVALGCDRTDVSFLWMACADEA